MCGYQGPLAVHTPTGASMPRSATTGHTGHNSVPLAGGAPQRLPPRIPPVSALAATMDRICTPPGSPVSSTSPSPLIMRTPWQQAFSNKYGVEYDSDFEHGGGPYNPGCPHPWERSSSTSSSSTDWVFDRRDHTTPPPSPRCFSLPDNPPRRRVTDIDRCDVSPKLMARGPRTRRGNSTTASLNSCLHESPRRTNCVAPTQSKAPPKRSYPKPRPTGSQYIQARRNRRSAARYQPKAQPQARQHAPKGPKAYRNKRDSKPTVEGKWGFFPTHRDLTNTEPIRLTMDETAPASYLTPQAAAVTMFYFSLLLLVLVYLRLPNTL